VIVLLSALLIMVTATKTWAGAISFWGSAIARKTCLGGNVMSAFRVTGDSGRPPEETAKVRTEGHYFVKCVHWFIRLRPVYTCNFHCDFWCDFLLLTDVNEWTSYKCMVKKNLLSTFVINPLIYIRQKEKIALKIAAKVASVNGPLLACLSTV
jgi:hypothetical protein